MDAAAVRIGAAHASRPRLILMVLLSEGGVEPTAGISSSKRPRGQTRLRAWKKLVSGNANEKEGGVGLLL